MISARLLKALLIGAGIAALAAGGAVGADALTDEQPERQHVDDSPRPETASLDATDADPLGRAPWRLRIFDSAGGLACSQAEAGQTQSNRIGHVRRNGEFYELRLEEGSSCVDLSNQVAGVIVTNLADVPTTVESEPEITTVRGIARAEVSRITIESPHGERVLEPTSRGGFLAVYAGKLTFADIDVRAALQDGTVVPLGD